MLFQVCFENSILSRAIWCISLWHCSHVTVKRYILSSLRSHSFPLLWCRKFSATYCLSKAHCSEWVKTSKNSILSCCVHLVLALLILCLVVIEQQCAPGLWWVSRRTWDRQAGKLTWVGRNETHPRTSSQNSKMFTVWRPLIIWGPISNMF